MRRSLVPRLRGFGAPAGTLPQVAGLPILRPCPACVFCPFYLGEVCNARVSQPVPEGCPWHFKQSELMRAVCTCLRVCVFLDVEAELGPRQR